MSEQNMKIFEMLEFLRLLVLFVVGRIGVDIEWFVWEVCVRCWWDFFLLIWDVLEDVFWQDDDIIFSEVCYCIVVYEVGYVLVYELMGLGNVFCVCFFVLGGEIEMMLDCEWLQFIEGIFGNFMCIFGGCVVEMLFFGEVFIGLGGGL